MNAEPILETQGISAGYGAAPVVREIDLKVCPGEIVALLGPNGAGKTTLLRTLAGEITPITGAVLWNGQSLPKSARRRAIMGLQFVTEERSVFMSLTVHENLRLGRGPVADALELFPELEPLLGRKVGLLSGGEQQILAVARTLAAKPTLLLADELSLGLAPIVTRRLLEAIRAATTRGLTALIVEQYVQRALAVCDRAYVLRRGRIVLSGDSGEVSSRIAEVEDSYLAGVGPL